MSGLGRGKEQHQNQSLGMPVQTLAAGHQLLGGTAEARIANLPMGALGEEDDQDDGFFNAFDIDDDFLEDKPSSEVACPSQTPPPDIISVPKLSNDAQPPEKLHQPISDEAPCVSSADQHTPPHLLSSNALEPGMELQEGPPPAPEKKYIPRPKVTSGCAIAPDGDHSDRLVMFHSAEADAQILAEPPRGTNDTPQINSKTSGSTEKAQQLRMLATDGALCVFTEPVMKPPRDETSNALPGTRVSPTPPRSKKEEAPHLSNEIVVGDGSLDATSNQESLEKPRTCGHEDLQSPPAVFLHPAVQPTTVDTNNAPKQKNSKQSTMAKPPLNIDTPTFSFQPTRAHHVKGKKSRFSDPPLSAVAAGTPPSRVLPIAHETKETPGIGTLAAAVASKTAPTPPPPSHVTGVMVPAPITPVFANLSVQRAQSDPSPSPSPVNTTLNTTDRNSMPMPAHETLTMVQPDSCNTTATATRIPRVPTRSDSQDTSAAALHAGEDAPVLRLDFSLLEESGEVRRLKDEERETAKVLEVPFADGAVTLANEARELGDEAQRVLKEMDSMEVEMRLMHMRFALDAAESASTARTTACKAAEVLGLTCTGAMSSAVTAMEVDV